MSDFSWDLGRRENHLGHLKNIYLKKKISVLGSQDRSSPVPGVDSGPSGQGMCYHLVEHVTFCLETHSQCSKVLENYSKIVFGWKVRVLRSTSFWIPVCLCLHSSLKQVYWMAFFSCKFNFGHMFCVWVIVRNDHTLRNHFGNSDNSKTTNFKDHWPLRKFILLTDITVK